MKGPSLFTRGVALSSATAVLSTICGCSATEAQTVSTQNIPTNTTPVVELSETRPNIVYVVLDDMGFSDLGCYGSEISTPNFDRLAEQGIRYNNYYTTPLSSPSRASLLTGRDNNVTGMGVISEFDFGEDYPTYRGRVTDDCGMISEYLQDIGYNTYASGKWHLAPTYTLSQMGPFDFWPLSKGFDHFYGFPSGYVDQFNPPIAIDNTLIEPENRPEGYHITNDLIDHTIDYLNTQNSLAPEKPFFTYLAFGAMHTPHQAPQEYIEKYDGKYDAGWDVIREQRFEKQKELGIVPQDSVLPSNNETVVPWDELTPEQQELYANQMEVYAGFLEHTDAQFGRLLDYLESTGEIDDTLFVLVSDNGATSEGSATGALSHPQYITGLEYTAEQTMQILDSLGGQEALGSEKTHSAYPHGWAQVSNTPFPYYKETAHLGGIRSPLIISYANGLPEEVNGSVCSQFCHVTDITPTVMDVLGLEIPESVDGVAQKPMTGSSIKYTFTDPDAEPTSDTQYFYMASQRSIYSDGWFAVAKHTPFTSFEEDTWLLYDLTNDFSQSHDIAAENPEKVAELSELWYEEADRYGAYQKGIEQITDNGAALWGYQPPYAQAFNRDTYVYYPGMQHIDARVAAPTNAASHRITSKINRDSASDQGVLIAYGGADSGYSFYIQDNHLIYEYNFCGMPYVIKSDCEVPTGECTVSFEYQKKDAVNGTGTLYIDGQACGSAELKTLPAEISCEGLDVGRDSRAPVSRNYSDEFPFTGSFESVTIELIDYQRSELPSIK